MHVCPCRNVGASDVDSEAIKLAISALRCQHALGHWFSDK